MTTPTVSDPTHCTAVSSEADRGLPADPDLLDPEDRNLLSVDHRELWPRLNREGRERMLERLRRQVPRERAAAEIDALRAELCARYVDLLCSMPKSTEPGFEQARIELMQAKEAYQALRGRGRSRLSRHR